jgi:hypothetical protein
MSTRLFLTSVFFVAASTIQADPGTAKPVLTITDLAVFSEAVVVARPRMITNSPKSTDGAVALWIEKSLKGRLRGGRDIIWVPRNELPKAEVGGAMWLLFLTQLGDQSWHVQTGNSEKNLITVDSLTAPVLAEVSKAVGNYAPRADAEPASAEEVAQWIHKAANGSRKARNEAFANLIAAGDSARSELLLAASSDDRETANVGRTLLPLTMGGPAVNGLRLSLEPTKQLLKIGERKMLTVNHVNLAERDIRVVTGTAAMGDNILSAAAYEVFPITDKSASAQALATVLPSTFGATIAGGGSPLPVIRVVPNLSVLPLTVDVTVENVMLDGKPELRLNFPHGYVALPGPGKYSVRVRFSGPGPRVDQQRLIDANYWGGGQLVSNTVELEIK